MTTFSSPSTTDGHLNDVTASALTAAAPAGRAGRMCSSPARASARAAEAAAKLAGVEKVRVADDALYAHGLAEPLAALIVRSPTTTTRIVAPATATSKNVLPRVAALLDVMQISDIIKVVSPDTFERPIYAGNAIQTVQSTDAKKVITVRTAASPRPAEGGSGADRDGRGGGRSGPVELHGRGAGQVGPAGTDLGQDHRLGRPGMRNARELQDYIEPVADKLGAAVGASRAAVDAGYAPNDWQVGQTGKVVAPDLYIAVGISGAIQHLAGMKDFEGHRRHQQGRGGADLPGRRLRPGRRPLHGAAGAERRTRRSTCQERQLRLCSFHCSARYPHRAAQARRSDTMDIAKIGVIGAGQMGSGIAQVCACPECPFF